VAVKSSCTSVIAAMFVLCIAIRTNLSARGEDWPQWRGPRGNGTWNGPNIASNWPAEGLPVVWQRQVGGGYAGVIVAGGRVFVADRQTEPEEVERLIALDAASGAVQWTHAWPVRYGTLDYGNGPRAAPTVFDGRVYVLGALGHVHCLDAEAGDVQWSKDYFGGDLKQLPEWGLAASPVIWNDLVIVHPGAKHDGCLVALDRRTGEEVWRSSADPAGYATPAVIAAPSGPQLVAWTPAHVLGLSLDSGRIFWRVPYKVTYGVSIATPIFDRAIVFVTGYWEGSKAIRLGPKAEDASLIWEDNRDLRGLMSQPLYRDGHVYSLDKQYGLTCFELETGKKLWDDGNKMTPRGRNPQATMVWIGDEDRAIVLNSDGELILARFNPAGYQEETRTKIIEATWAHPAYAGDCVYARNDTTLVCLRLAP